MTRDMNRKHDPVDATESAGKEIPFDQQVELHMQRHLCQPENVQRFAEAGVDLGSDRAEKARHFAAEAQRWLKDMKQTKLDSGLVMVEFGGLTPIRDDTLLAGGGVPEEDDDDTTPDPTPDKKKECECWWELTEAHVPTPPDIGKKSFTSPGGADFQDSSNVGGVVQRTQSNCVSDCFGSGTHLTSKNGRSMWNVHVVCDPPGCCHPTGHVEVETRTAGAAGANSGVATCFIWSSSAGGEGKVGVVHKLDGAEIGKGAGAAMSGSLASLGSTSVGVGPIGVTVPFPTSSTTGRAMQRSYVTGSGRTTVPKASVFMEGVCESRVVVSGKGGATGSGAIYFAGVALNCVGKTCVGTKAFLKMYYDPMSATATAEMNTWLMLMKSKPWKFEEEEDE